jgi:hypothetical protein
MQPANNCDHTETRAVYRETYNDWTGETEGNWETEKISLVSDIDLHRFQCTRCKMIGYYSSAARSYFEDGKRTPGIEGLE